METAFFPLLSAMTAKITATAPEWKALLRLLPPAPEARPILRNRDACSQAHRRAS